MSGAEYEGREEELSGMYADAAKRAQSRSEDDYAAMRDCRDNAIRITGFWGFKFRGAEECLTYAILGDSTSRDGRRMLWLHLYLKAGAPYNTEAMNNLINEVDAPC